VRVPDDGATLRGLIGLSHDAPAGCKAQVSLKLIGPEREWPLMSSLEVEAHARETDDRGTTRSNLPAVVEVVLPTEMKGEEGRIALKVTTTADEEFALAVPYLTVSL